MESRKWMDDILDDKAEGEQEASSDESRMEDPSKIQDFLHRINELEKAGKIACHEKEVKDEYGKLGKPDGRQVLHALMALNGAPLLDALSGAGALGRVLEGHGGITFFALSIVLSYVALFLKPKAVRSILVLSRLLFYRDGARKTESFSKGLGCSKNRTRKALEEVKENGLARPGRDGNAPGSGRPTIKSLFAGVMTGFLLAVTGLDEAALEKECSRRRIESRSSSAAPADNEDVVMEPATLGSVKEGYDKLRAICDDVILRTDRAIGTAERVQAHTLKILKENLICAMAKLEKAMEEAAGWEDTSKEDGTATGSGRSAEPSLEEEAERYAEGLKARVLPKILSPIISLLTERCNGILEAFEEAKGKNSYQLVKEARKKAKPKSLANDLANLWWIYHLTLQDIATMAADHRQAAASSQQPVQVDADDMTADMEGMLKHVMENLNDVKEKLTSGSKDKTATVKKAIARLEKLSETLGGDHFHEIFSSQYKEAGFILAPMFHYLDRCCRRWLACWTDGASHSKAADKAADAVMSEGFAWGLAYFMDQLNSYMQHYQDGPATTAPREGDDPREGDSNPQEGDSGPQDAAAVSEILKKSREETGEAVLAVLDMIRQLEKDLGQSLAARKERKNKKESRIPGALAFLKDISQHLETELELMEEKEDIYATQTLSDIAGWIREFLEGRLMKWEKDEGGRRIIGYSYAERIAGSLSTKGNSTHLNMAWERLEKIHNGTLRQEAPGKYIGVEELGAIGEWFMPDAYLSPEARYRLVLKLWQQGKDPRDLETWISYIISDEYDRNYGDPCDRMKCCRITRMELQTAFHCLTGVTCAKETLWTVLTKDMGYTGRQCGKLDQVGKPSEYRNEQFMHIKKKQEGADPERTLVVSLDTKAFLLLGRLKHDNGRIMCRKDGRVYRVLDHDFALELRQIYPNGTFLVDESRLDEKAILHPVGAYCPADGTGYVALVLGKDTAESVCNLLRMVIDIKRRTMPKLDTVLILADGGGSNMSNGVTWQAELLKLADDKNVTLDVMHFSPGTSRHNPVEHRLFSALSQSWKGKPFIDIEHVLGYVNGTHNKSLTVQGWFDTKRYLTNKEKKAIGEKVWTREELDKEANGRITHEFPEGDMYKWNYVVRPSVLQKEGA